VTVHKPTLVIVTVLALNAHAPVAPKLTVKPEVAVAVAV
jgi:hypothetical protein